MLSRLFYVFIQDIENKENSSEKESVDRLKRENKELKREVSTLKEIIWNLRGKRLYKT